MSEQKFRVKNTLSSKSFWNLFSAQTLSGVILLFVTISFAGLAGILTFNNIFSVVLSALVLILPALAFLAIYIFRPDFYSWSERKFSASRNVALGLNLVYKVFMILILPVGIIGMIMLTSGIQDESKLNAHVDPLLTIYTSKLPFDSPLNSELGLECYQTIYILSNQSPENIILLDAIGRGRADGNGTGLIDRVDLEWIRVAGAFEHPTSGPLKLLPGDAALVRMTSSNEEVSNNFSIKPASPTVQLVQRSDQVLLSPSITKLRDSFGAPKCHKPLIMDSNLKVHSQ